jgi:hypothetical protein
VHHVRRIVKDLTQTMSAEFAHDGAMVFARASLDRCAEISKGSGRFDHCDAGHHGLVGRVHQALRFALGNPDGIHAACIAVPTVDNHGHVDVQNVFVTQHAIAWNSMANDVIERRAKGVPITAIENTGRQGAVIQHEFTCAIVEIARRHALPDFADQHVQAFGCKSPRPPHAFECFVRRVMQLDLPGIAPRRRACLHVIEDRDGFCLSHGAVGSFMWRPAPASVDRRS